MLERAFDPAVANAPAHRGPSKLLGLEVIRFISALAVLIWHYQLFYYIADKPGPDYIVQNQPLYTLFLPFYQAGHYGVKVFWCISGFIFFWKYRNAIANRFVTAKHFFWLRFSRLYPLHLFTLVLVAGLQAIYFSAKGFYFIYIENDLYHFMLQLFFASNWGFQQSYSFNGPIWSISVEVLIYVLFFTSLRLFGTSIWVGAGAILIACTAKAARIESPILECLGFFYLGGLTAVAREQIARRSFANSLNLALVVLAVLIPFAAAMAGAFAIRHFSYIFWLAYSPLLIYVCAGDLRVGPRVQSAIEAAGNMTYSSYLIHFPLQLIIALTYIYLRQPMPVSNPAFLLGFLLTTLILAYIIFEMFERPAQRAVRARINYSGLAPKI